VEKNAASAGVILAKKHSGQQRLAQKINGEYVWM